jgi:UDP-glucose 4-epimerase
MNILVTGGAGYVGSHTAKQLRDEGHTVVLFDSLERGKASVAGTLALPLIVGNLADTSLLERTLAGHRIDVVMHFAAYAYVDESVEKPLLYYHNNVALTIGLLQAMEKAGVNRLVFSSSCVVYGEPEKIPIVEADRTQPSSPYGRTKLIVENILADHLAAHPEFSYAALRYFNASGCAMDGTLGDEHDPETRLIPIILDGVTGRRPHVTIYGTDYPTPDGTAVRDYIHVDDLGAAHALAMTALRPGQSITVNLGTGRGVSVLEAIQSVERVTGKPVPVVKGPRRAGDPPALFANADLAARVLGWKAKHTSVDEIVSSSWKWRTRR